jgi:hypothetical protein
MAEHSEQLLRYLHRLVSAGEAESDAVLLQRFVRFGEVC